jgi:hypothetical protein
MSTVQRFHISERKVSHLGCKLEMAQGATQQLENFSQPVTPSQARSALFPHLL